MRIFPRHLRNVLNRLPRRWKIAAGGLGLALPLRPLAPRTDVHALQPGPVILSGFLSDSRGVAEAGRLTLAALRRAGYPVIAHDVTFLLMGGARTPPPMGMTGGVWLLHCNPTEADQVLRLYPELAAAPLYRIGYWVWELQTAPTDWHDFALAFHSIWVPSRFVADALATLPTAVTVMPHPVGSPSPSVAQRTASQGVHFLTMADARSSLERKNPAGTIKAYIKALPVSREVRLTVKLSGMARHSTALGALRGLAAGRPDITFITKILSAQDLEALLRDTDVLVSLHRAEGFGLPIAEAMAAGKPIIATGWSGPMDFLANDSIQRIGYSLTPVFDPSGVYSLGMWAEPDIEQAARSIAALAGDVSLRVACGRRSQAALSRTLLASWSAEALKRLPFSSFVAAYASD